MIRLVKSTFYNEADTKKRLTRFINGAKQLSFGEHCKKFETDFAKWQGKKYAVFFNSGSSANLALIQALINTGTLQKDDWVGFSSLTWATNVMPLIQLGFNALSMKVEPDTLNTSSAEVEKIIKKHPLKAIFLTNLLGFCHDIDAIKKICDKHRVVLIEDNCESLGSVYKGKKLGNYGLASTFSFFVGHHMSTIEGGMVCTDNAELAKQLRMVRAHGWDRHVDEKQQKKLRKDHNVDPFYGLYTFYDLAYNLRPSEINGFLGHSQIKYLDQITAKREKIYHELAKNIYALSDIVQPMKSNHMDTLSAFALPIVCRSEKIKNDLIVRCHGKVEIRPIVGGNMLHQPFFHKHHAHMKDHNHCDTASFVHENGFYMPINPEMTKKDIATILSIFK